MLFFLILSSPLNIFLLLPCPKLPIPGPALGVGVERNEIRALKQFCFDKRGIGSKYYFRVNFATMSSCLEVSQSTNTY